MDVCSQHEKMMEMVHNIDKTTTALSVRINGSIGDIEKHLEMGAAWRIAIVGVIISIVLQVITFSYLWGSASKQIEINRIVCELHKKIAKLEMLRHEFIDGNSKRQRTYFADGTVVEINLDTDEYVIYKICLDNEEH